MVTEHTERPSLSSTGTLGILNYTVCDIELVYRSEVVGRPLAALLSNDGARVFSADIDSIQEYTKRPRPLPGEVPGRRYHPHHVVRSCTKSLEECLAVSDVVISAVPNVSYKVRTGLLKDGCICVNVASEKNFEPDVREKVRSVRLYPGLLIANRVVLYTVTMHGGPREAYF